MNDLSLTLGQAWVDQYLYGIFLLHILIGNDVSLISPKTEVSLQAFTEVLQEISSGVYNPATHFQLGGFDPRVLIAQPPALPPQSRHILICLNASTARAKFISTQTGGIAYENPIWAIFAAYAISRNESVAIPLADNNEKLWENLRALDTSVRQHRYSPRQYFGEIEGFFPPNSRPEFTLLSVDADQLEGLRKRGMQTLKVSVPPKFYELFQKPPH